MWILDHRYGYSEEICVRCLPVCYGEDLISSPNFDNSIFPVLLETLISRFADPNDSSNMDVLLNLLELDVRLSRRSLTSLATRGMHGWSRGLLIRSLNLLVRRCHGPRWLFSSFCTVVETHREPSRSSSQSYHRESEVRRCHGPRWPFSSFCTAVETHREPSRPSSQSYHRESEVRHCHGPRWPFSSFCTLIKAHREPSRSCSQSYHRESDHRHNHNMLGNSEIIEGNGNNMPRGRASAKESRNSIPCDTSSNKRKSQEQETHFEEQPTEIQNSNPKRLALNHASGYSYNLNPIIQITGHNVMDSTHMGVEPSLESISTQPLNSTSCFEQAKLNFNNLIQLPLKEIIINPENETCMKKALSILADNLSLFSEEQAEQILELLFDFPALVHSWREYSQCQMYSQKSSAETEKIRDLLKTSVKDEERVKVRYEELKIKEKELMTQLAAVQKEKAEIAEQRTEKSKQIKDLISSAEEKANKEECLMKIATTKLNNLSDQWTKLQSFFI